MKLFPKPKRILVIRLSSAGDLVLTSLLLRCLRKRFPRAHLGLLTHQRFSPLADGFSQLQAQYELTKNFMATKTLIRKIRDDDYDTVIDLQNSVTSRRLTAQLSPLRIFRFRRSRWNRWQRIHLPWRRKYLKTPPSVAVAYLSAVRPLDVVDDGQGLEMQVSEAWQKAAQQRISEFTEAHQLDQHGPLLLAAPGAAHGSKQWLTEYWIELLRQAQTAGLTRQILLGSKQEAPQCAEIAAALTYPVLNTAGDTDLGELTALIEAGSVLVTNDSAPMHLAASVGTPLVAIFGPTVPEFGFAPLRCQHEIAQVSNLKCRPCHKHGFNKCPLVHFRCLREIKPELILPMIQKLLDGQNRSTAEAGAE